MDIMNLLLEVCFLVDLQCLGISLDHRCSQFSLDG